MARAIKAAVGSHGTVRLSNPAPLMRDSALDSDIVWHEYGHGLTWRMIGGMSGAMAGAIGEGMGDVLAILVNGDDRVGEYAASDPAGIRSVPYGAYTKTYKAAFTATEVHLDGELYGAIGWRLRQQLRRGCRPVVGLHGRRHELHAGNAERSSRCATASLAERSPTPDDECKVWDAFADFGVGVGAQATLSRRGTWTITESTRCPAAARRFPIWDEAGQTPAPVSDWGLTPCNSYSVTTCPVLHALIRRQHDPQAVDGVVHVIRQIHVLLNGPQEERLLAIAQPLVIGLVLGVDELVGPDELVVGRRARA